MLENTRNSDPQLKSVQRRLMIPLAIGLLLLIVGFIVTQALLHKQQLSISNRQQVDSIFHTLEISIQSETKLLIALQDLILSSIDVATLLKYRKRDELLAVFKTHFDNLRLHQDITRFYFHLPDGTNLLRMHEPDRYDDFIDRLTMRQARASRQLVSGLELGSLGVFTLRAITPVFHGEELVGYLELGKGIDSLLAQFQALENIEVAFMIHKEALHRKLWDHSMAQSNINFDWDRFDNAVLSYSSNEDIAGILEHFLQRAHHETEHTHTPNSESIGQHEHSSGVFFETLYKGQPALLSVIPFADVSGQLNTDLVLISNISESAGIFKQVTSVSSALALLVFILLSSFLYAFLRRVDQGITNQQLQLLDTNDRLNKAISVAEEGIWDWDLRSQQVSFDERYYSLAGYRPGEFRPSYQSFLEHVHPDDVTAVETAVNDYLQQKTENYDIEFRFACKDGSYMWIRARGKIFAQDETGKPLRFVGTHSDITERKLAQKSLAKSEERFRGLVETSQDWVWEVDANGVFTYASPRCFELLGYSADEIVGKTPFELMLEEEASKLLPEFQRMVSQQESIKALVNINRHKDGRDVVLETSGVPFFHANGKLAGYRGIDRDITQRRRIEQQLREGERKYRLLVEGQTDMVVEVDPEGRFMFVSPSYCEMFDKTEQQLLGNTFLPLVHEDDQESTREAMEKLYQPPYNCYLEQRAMTREGWRWLEWMDSAVLDENGKIQSIIGVGRDITERKRIEQQLTDSEEKFSKAFFYQPIAMEIVDLDTGSRIEFNDRYCELSGFTREEFIKTSIYDKNLWIDPKQQKKAVREIREKGFIHDFPMIIRQKSGSHRNLLLSAAMLNVTRQSLVIASLVDITDLIAAENALRESESRYRFIFNQQYQFMAILSEQGITLEINDLPLRTAGYTRKQVIGKEFWLTPFWVNKDEWAGIWQQRLKDARDSQMPQHSQDVYQTKAGELRHTDSSTSAFVDEHGKVLFYLVQASDITERQSAEKQRDQLLREVQSLNVNLELRVKQRTAQLASVNRELESFSYSVSHDLRAPLRAIDGFSLALQEDYGEKLDDTGHDYLDRVRKSAQRMGRLIDDLLKLSRVNRNEMVVRKVDLNQVAEEVLDELRSVEPQRKTKIILGQDLTVEGDPRLLRIMLDNLLGNAWKFSSKQEVSQITFDRCKHDPQLFFIKDNGVGFSMSHADKLFGAFQRLHRATEFPGTGIGLATVQRILNRHGGKIWADSTEGEGATFYFSLAADNSDQNQQKMEHGGA